MEDLTVQDVIDASPIDNFRSIEDDIIIADGPGFLLLNTNGFYIQETRNIVSELLCGEHYEGKVYPLETDQELRNPAIGKLAYRIANIGQMYRFERGETLTASTIVGACYGKPEDIWCISSRRPIRMTYGQIVRPIFSDLASTLLFRAEVASLITLSSGWDRAIWAAPIRLLE